MPAYVTVATDRTIGNPPGAYPCRATIVWPNGTEQDEDQVGKYLTYYNQYRAKPASFFCQTCEGAPSGFLYKFRPTGQTFTYSNQYQLSYIKMISAKGITSFDMDISQCTNLENVSIGLVLNDVGISGQMPWGTDNTDTSAAITSISDFTTIFPASTYGAQGNSKYSIFNFWYNTAQCNFNPTFQYQPTLISKWRFDFQFNAQQYLDIDCSGFNKITIINNPSLSYVKLSGLSGISWIENTNYNLNLAGNLIDDFQLNGLSGITINNNAHKLNINLSNNNLGSKVLPSNTITSFPPFLNTNIDFSSNKFTTWATTYSGSALSRLSLNNQTPGLSYIDWSSTLNSPFKEFDFSYNLLIECPPISAETRYLDIRNNNIVSNGANNPEIYNGLCLPNFVQGMTHFYGGSTAGSGKLNIYGRWTPNTADQYNTPLSTITTWQVFDIQYSFLNEATVDLQFSTTMTHASSTIYLSNNSYTTFDLSKLGGFRNIYLSNNQLLNVTNLKNLTQPELIDLNGNANLGQNDTTSNVLIPNSDTWPATLKTLNLGRNKIQTWTKSFTSFATNPPNSTMSFTWHPAQNQTPTAPVPIQESVSFIIRDIITGTTKTLGTLNLSSSYNSGVGGATSGAATYALRYPLSSQSTETLDCLNCLTASTITPCTASGLNSTNFGRGFTVRLLYV